MINTWSLPNTCTVIAIFKYIWFSSKPSCFCRLQPFRQTQLRIPNQRHQEDRELLLQVYKRRNVRHMVSRSCSDVTIWTVTPQY